MKGVWVCCRIVMMVAHGDSKQQEVHTTIVVVDISVVVCGGIWEMWKYRDGDRSLQLLIFNEEFLVSASHQLALTTSLLLKFLGLSSSTFAKLKPEIGSLTCGG